MKTIRYCLILGVIILLVSCTKGNTKETGDSLAVTPKKIVESVDVIALGVTTVEKGNKMIGQDVVYKKANDTFTLSFRRSMPKSGDENILVMAYYDKIPVETSVSSLQISFSDGKVFESSFFFPLTDGQFGAESGKDSGKKIQGLTVLVDSQDKINLKNSTIASVKATFESGDQITVPISGANAIKIKEFMNQSYKDYL